MTDGLSLRTLLRLDALTCLGCGLALSLASGPLGALFGLPPALLLGAGLLLLPCAALMLFTAERALGARALLLLIVVGNWAWAAASLGVLALAAPTALGAAFVLAQAGLVAGFAWLESRAAARAPQAA